MFSNKGVRKIFYISCIFVVFVFAFAAYGGDPEDAGTSSNGLASNGNGSNGGNSSGGNSSNSSTSNASTMSSGAEISTENTTLVYIAPGSFTMGSASVTLTKMFLMGKYQVTQELYQQVMGSNPSSFTSGVTSGEVQARRPVENLNWYSTLVFCNKLSILEGLSPVYTISGSTDPSNWGSVPTSSNSTWNAVTMNSSANGYRLPTEAEWEYACRAGSTTTYNLGSSWSGDWGWYSGNSGSKTHEVGLKTANAWGLYDMHGNVWEWVWDWYSSSLGTSSVNDPVGIATGSLRVVRGGGWSNGAQGLRSAYRGGSYYPNYGDYGFGFRVVRVIIHKIG
jgi:formylglycine-generating enzyme required for sulfatase activity